MSLRRSLLITALATTAVGLAWLIQAKLAGWVGAKPLASGQWYALETAPDSATFDLGFEPGERYLLIVTSLGAPQQLHRVTLTSQPVGRPEYLPAHRLEPLPADRRREMPLAAKRVSQARPERSTSSDPSAASEREFFLHVTDGALDDRNSYARVRGRLIAEGSHVRIYLDRGQRPRELASGLVDEIVYYFDHELIPATAKTLGTYCDVDGDGKFSILLSPWLDRLQGGKTSLGGFVRSSDFRTDLEAPLSNKCDMLYLNSGLTADTHLRTLLAHEFTHAICCSQRLSVREAGRYVPDEEDWLNEAIAHVAENMFASGWSNLDHRVHEFLNEPEAYPLIVPDYYRAGLWRNHGCRGATYLFLRWCVDQFGEPVLVDLVRGPASGTQNVERATALPFAELYRRWSIALAEEGPASGGRDGSGAGGAGYHSLDLGGEVGSWLLAGPKTDRWDVDRGGKALELAGTASAYVELHSGRREGCSRIRLSCDYGTRLQVSILKLPPERPRLDVAARWLFSEHADSVAVTSKSADRIEVELGLESGGALEIEHVVLEPRSSGPARQVRFQGAELAKILMVEDDRSEQARNRVVLSVASQAGIEQGCIAKIVAHDAGGRRITAWRSIGAAKEWRSQFAYADTGGTTVRQ